MEIRARLMLLSVWLLATTLAGCGSVEPLPSSATAEDEATPPPVEEEEKTVAAIDDKKRKGEATSLAGPIINARRSAEVFTESQPIIQAIQFFHAENGRYPKSHEEFMKKVVEYNKMRLPKVDEGYELIYHPEYHKVYIQPIDWTEEEAKAAVKKLEEDAADDF